MTHLIKFNLTYRLEFSLNDATIGPLKSRDHFFLKKMFRVPALHFQFYFIFLKKGPGRDDGGAVNRSKRGECLATDEKIV